MSYGSMIMLFSAAAFHATSKTGGVASATGFLLASALGSSCYKQASPPARRSRLDSSAVLVLCLNLGRTSTSHCRRKTKSASKSLGFLVNVRFWSALVLTLNQRVRSSSLTLCSIVVVLLPNASS